jgi:hypothetical protein
VGEGKISGTLAPGIEAGTGYHVCTLLRSREHPDEWGWAAPPKKVSLFTFVCPQPKSRTRAATTVFNS